MPALLIRHGATSLNSDTLSKDKIRGWIDVPISPEGIKQAQDTADKVAPYPMTRLYSSDLSRAANTAEEIQRKTGLPLTLHPELRPWNLGVFQGQPTEKVLPIIQQLVERPDARAPGGGESFNDFMQRYVPFIGQILAKPELSGVVTHIRNIKAIEAVIAGKGQLDKGVWDRVPSVKPGGFVMVTPDAYDPKSPSDPAHRGLGS